MDNRQTRRAKLSAFKKQLKNAEFDNFEDRSAMAISSQKFPKGMGVMIGFYVNSIYSVQVYQRKDGTKLAGIRRHDQKPSCPWSHKQKIKNFVFGNEENAIEIFPSESKLIDQANMYWIFSGSKVNEFARFINGLKDN